MSTYKFQPPSPNNAPGALLPAGDYTFTIVDFQPPHVNEKSGNLVCAVKIAIQPDGQTVFANPWAGVDKGGNARDQIAELLVAINRAPKPGAEPNWQSCTGARGKCKLKVEDDLNGVPRNKVAYFHTPKQATANPTNQTSATTADFNKARAQAVAKAGGPANNDVEPDDIPF